MATIADTLNDIQKLQEEISSKRMESKECSNSTFTRDLMNFTTICFFELLAHTTLDALRSQLEPIRHPYADKYYSMYKESGVLQELIRLNNISGIFVLWNIFEQHIDKVRTKLSGEPERNLEDRYKKILRDIGVDKRRYDTMINEFNLIRLTRNSLHGGGLYRKKNERNFTLKGRKYTLKPGEAVSPLRIMDVAETMWEHFVVIAEITYSFCNPSAGRF